jgi:nicotinate dehydrogenase subunit A
LAPMPLSVNGRTVSVRVDDPDTLLYVLRNELGLQGPRFGCGLGQCGGLHGTYRRGCGYLFLI